MQGTILLRCADDVDVDFVYNINDVDDTDDVDNDDDVVYVDRPWCCC